MTLPVSVRSFSGYNNLHSFTHTVDDHGFLHYLNIFLQVPARNGRRQILLPTSNEHLAK
jgi:hypothetical protein